MFSDECIRKVEAGIAKNLRNPSQYSESLVAAGGSGAYFNDYCNWRSIEEFRDYVYNSPAKEIAGRLTMSKKIAFYHEHVLIKEPQAYKTTPWHHDQSYYPVDGFKNCSIWMPIDSVSQNTSVQFIKGSHKWGKWYYPRKFATSSNYKMETHDLDHNYEDIPDFDGSIEDYTVLQWDVEPGDCVVFHMMTIHGAPANTTMNQRRILSTRWLGDDCTFAKRPWTPSPPITAGLKPGDSMACDEFPIVWEL